MLVEKKLNALKRLKLISFIIFISVFLTGCQFFSGSDNKIKLDQTDVQLTVGETITINVIKYPDGVDQNVNWSSSDENVVTVENGVVEAIGIGTAKITVSIGDVFAYVNVTVSIEFSEGYVLTYEVYGGTLITEQIIADGEVTVEPSEPTKDGLVFGGWFLDEEFLVPFTFGQELTANTTIYAKWNGGHQVIFETLSGSSIFYVAEGEIINPPIDPEKPRYQFLGWGFEIDNVQTVYDFSQPITSDMVFKAIWEQTEFTIFFVVNYGDPIDDQTVLQGEKIKNPFASDEEEIFEIEGFYVDENFETRIDLDVFDVTTDLTIYVNLTPILFGTATFVLNDGSFTISASECFLDEDPLQVFNLKYFNPNQNQYQDDYNNAIFLINKKATIELTGNGLYIGINLNNNGLYEVGSSYQSDSDFNISDHDYILFGYNDYQDGYAFLNSLTQGQVLSTSNFNDMKQEGIVNGFINVYSSSPQFTENEVSLYYSQKLSLIPVKEGYSFAGWYLSPEYSGNVQTVFYFSSTYYAKWVEGDLGEPNIETFDNLDYDSGIDYYQNMIISSTYNRFYGWSLRNVNGVPSQYQIDGNGALLVVPYGHNDLFASEIQSNLKVSGGMRSFSVDLRKAFDNDEERKVELILNGISYGIFTLDNNNPDVQKFTVDNINIDGDVRILLRHVGQGNQLAGIVVDNITWYPSGD